MTEHPNFPRRYQPTGKIFKGGQGDIYICTDANLNRRVAIKLLKNVKALESSRQEVASLSNIRSKHLVELYDFFVKENLVGLVEEYISGEDLTNYFRSRPSLEDYLKTLYQIASGIADIHAGHKIHRDIKPSHIKFNEERIVKIFDFDLSCNAGPDAKTIAARGTLGYRAPELYQRPPIYFTPAVDTYAFGVTAWRIIKGDLPEEIITPLYFWNSTSGGLPEITPPPFAELQIGWPPTGLPSEIVQILTATFNTNPKERPAMSEVRDTLARRLLFEKHRAILTHNNQTYAVSKQNPTVNINVSSLGSSLIIKYDGLFFTVNGFSGDVYLNNTSILGVGRKLPDSCIITIGKPSSGPHRLFITFDVSHPEVVL